MRFHDKVRSYTKEYFEGISQALFFENAWFGAAFLALALAFNWQLFACGIAASLVGFAHSKIYRTSKILQACGLITINGFFFGIALASLYRLSPQFYVYLAVGSLTVPLVTKAAFEVLQHWKLNPLVLPYILVVWILLLCAGKVALPPSLGELEAGLVHLENLGPYGDVLVPMLVASLVGIGRFFFYPSAFFGGAIVLLMLAFSPRRGIYFLLGSFFATLVSFVVSDGTQLWEYGFANCSAGIVALGLSAMPERYRLDTIFLFCVISLFVTVACEHFFSNLGLVTLSVPYVFTFWLARLSRGPRINVGWAVPTAEIL